jgi:aldehyde dehydrogenase (NAD+)
LVYDPSRAAPIAEVEVAGEADVDYAIHVARRAFDEGPWPRLSPLDRAACLHRIADVIREHGPRLAELESSNNGKPIRDTAGEIETWAAFFDYFGGLAVDIRGDTIPHSSEIFAYTSREPVGVVAAIVPWNSPLMMAICKIAPALAAGCVVIVKPASWTPLTALELASLTTRAGLPAGVLNVVVGPGDSAGMRLVEHPGVDKIAFTGDSATGALIQERAARTIKRVSLELGGKSANIVFADADLDAAERGVTFGVFASAGESCVAGSRLLVERSVYGDFLHRLAARTERLRVGDPLDTNTQVGAIVSERQLNRIESYVQTGSAEGAHLLVGGHRLKLGDSLAGWFHQPTVFADVDNKMRIAREEIFGPVLSVIPFQTEEDAIAIANDSPYGLAAGIWTNDIRRGHSVARQLRVGTVWINTYRKWSPMVPFGGYKASGYGRENGAEVMRLYTEVKSVWSDLGHEVLGWSES